jgi:hypothetical protein
VLNADAADFELTPSLSLSEEYDDNVFLSNTDKKGDFITRLVPEIAIKYKTSFWDWAIKGAADYRYYANRTVSDNIAPFLDAKGKIELLKERLFLDVSDLYQRTSLSLATDFTQVSLSQDQSDKNVFTASPYVLLRPSSLLTVKTGYTYANIWYKDPDAVNKTDHTGYMEATYELSARVMMTAGYRFTYEDSDLSILYRHDVYAGSRYEYAEGSFVEAKIGNSWLDYREGDNFSKPTWNVTLHHTFSLLTLDMTTSQDFQEDPLGSLNLTTTYSVGVRRELKKAKIGLIGFLREYDESDTGVKTKNYGATADLFYEIAPKTNGKCWFTVERLKDEEVDDTTRRYTLNVQFDHAIYKNVLLTLMYQHTESRSSEIASNEYTANRVMAGLRIDF